MRATICTSARGQWMWITACVIASMVVATPARAQNGTTCENVQSSICSSQGFQISLVNFSIDQNAGTSHWDYEVCNDKNLGGACLPPKDLSHVNIDLPDLGTCLNPGQTIQLAQIGGFGNATLACGVSEKDPSCDIFGTPGLDFVAKCDVVGPTDLDPGECVVMRLSIAGEQPTLGAGVAYTVTKAGRDCATDAILGPSCEPCEPLNGDKCFTRSAGFWGTHPGITDLYDDGITVCGQPLTRLSDTIETLCTNKVAKKAQPALESLKRQLAAAKLNLAVTSSLEGGNCNGERTWPSGVVSTVAARIGQCETLCSASQSGISSSGCIGDLDAFNRSQDTYPSTPVPFDRPGPAEPSQCRAARLGLQ